MTYNILDFSLRIKAGRFQSMADATLHAIDNFDQSQEWFIEDPMGDFVAIIYRGTVWVPQKVVYYKTVWIPQNQESEEI